MLPRHRRRGPPSFAPASPVDLVILQGLREELSFVACSGLFGSLSFEIHASFRHCVTVRGTLLSVLFEAFAQKGRDVVSDLDDDLAFDVVGTEALALPSSVVALSMDKATVSSAVDSPAAGEVKEEVRLGCKIL